jgi:hypothetical protein
LGTKNLPIPLPPSLRLEEGRLLGKNVKNNKQIKITDPPKEKVIMILIISRPSINSSSLDQNPSLEKRIFGWQILMGQRLKNG